jgi:murein DD-endopeptidase MepM/ murein hydrolase activator NlpD
LTTASGTVIRTGYTGNGNYVKVKHNNTYSTQYTHVKILVRRGQHVNQGDVIGRVGSTGLATGPHVCYRFGKMEAS